ncbi:MAG: diguanylate cyclase domain-containing protein [Bilophila wadsworthia]
MDLDGFKNVNDTLGHLEGDTLLQLVARELESCFREGDIVGRLGGDEFIALMHGVSTRKSLSARLGTVCAHSVHPHGAPRYSGSR